MDSIFRIRRIQSPEPVIGPRQLVVALLAGLCAYGVLGAPFEAAPPAPGPEGSQLEDYVREFERSYHAVRTLRADFTQTYQWGDRTRVESGTVFFARGGLMRWDYREPAKKLFLSDGKRLLLYVPDEKQLTRTPLKASDDVRVPFRLLLSRLNLRKVFSKIEFAGDGQPPRATGDRVLRAFPKRGFEDEYREVLIELTPAFDVRRLVVTYPDHGVMEFEFDRIARNAQLDPALFRFTPPAGTEIIDE